MWITQVSAIYSQAGCSDEDLCQALASLLKGNAAKWFGTLTDLEREKLSTWNHWKAALRRAYRGPNFEHTARAKCYSRQLGNNEFFADYYQDKRSLQKYAYAEDSTHRELIYDMRAGIPPKFHPTLKTLLKPWDEVEDFRRHLIDAEQGLRPWLFDDQGNTKKKFTVRKDDSDSESESSSGHKKYHRKKPAHQSAPRSKRAPPSACECGGMHWRSDCPKGNQSTNKGFNSTYNSRYPNYGNGNTAANGNNRGSQNRNQQSNGNSGSNNTGNKWNNNKGSNNNQTAAANTVKVVSNPVRTRKQKNAVQQEEPKKTPEPATIEAEVVPRATVDKDVPLQERYMNKIPTYAKAYIDSNTGVVHDVCLDTGSSISLIDLAYLKKHFPTAKIETSSMIQLEGVGSNTTHGWVELTVNLLGPEKQITIVIVAFHVVASLATTVLIGNDVLVPEDVSISLGQNYALFGTTNGIVTVFSAEEPLQIGDNLLSAARTTQAFVIRPGF